MPKRSTGCYACRARKVRCDEAKPECNTCLRRGQKCPGYRPTQAFIMHTFTTQTERHGTRLHDENTCPNDDHHHHHHHHRDDNPSASPGSEKALAVRQPQHLRVVEVHVPPQVNPIPADRIAHLDNFLSMYCPSMQKGKTLTPPTALVYNLPSAANPRQVLLAAIDAVSAAQLAASNKTEPLVNRSRSLYGTALVQLMRSLQRPEATREDETLMAAYLLGLYEVYVGITNGLGFVYHTQGMLRLLRARGPTSIRSEMSMLAYNSIRYNSLVIGYTARRAGYLDSPEWVGITSGIARTDPWTSLMDTIIAIPRILEDTDKLIAFNPSLQRVEELLSRSRLLEKRLLVWFADFEKNGPLYDEVDMNSLERFPKFCDDRRFPTVFAFRTYGYSNSYSLYWTSMLLLGMNSLAVNQKVRSLPPEELNEWESGLFEIAECICRTVPWSCQSAAGYTGRFTTLTPLRFAKQYFDSRGHARESAWCVKAYYGAFVPGLYQPAIPITPSRSHIRALKSSSNYV